MTTKDSILFYTLNIEYYFYFCLMQECSSQRSDEGHGGRADTTSLPARAPVCRGEVTSQPRYGDTLSPQKDLQ